MPEARPRRDAVVTAASRLLAASGLLALVGALPWLASRDPALTVLRARYADREATPEALAAVRAELGLDAGPFALLGKWVSGLLRGDLGTSWISGRPVGRGLLDNLSVSLTLVGFSLVVAFVVAAASVAVAMRAGLRGRPSFGSGSGSVLLTALPEFLLATVLLLVGAVWLGWFPPFGWDGPGQAVLPALALGLPAGGLLGRLTATAVTAVFTEPWVTTWRGAGFTRREVALAVLRRAVPSVLPQLGLVVVGLTGGAVAVEEIFAIPGIGRALLGAAAAQDLPALQAGLLLLVVVAAVAGGLASLVGRLMLGRAVRLSALSLPEPVVVLRRRDLLVPGAAGALLIVVVVAGLLGDPSTSARPRLAPPSPGLWLGADASGRDLLARVGHGALTTVGTGIVVLVLCLLIGLAVGCLSHAATGPIEIANAAPPVLAGLVVAAVAGPSQLGAAVAVTAVSWAPLAAHTSALLREARSQPHVAVLPVLGVGPVRRLVRHTLPAVVPAVTRHAALRLPGIVLALASLGFLGLGARPPRPEWGLVLAEGSAYVERAPWTALGPAGALVLVSVLSVGATAVLTTRRSGRATPTAA
ncbi:ABC transporter permease subunit [Aeromicrobium sp.]|uniref:ABC transporter permease subunit n=1 Tax=Aeromicrobium sp. TaxID=1871063 RepID=UPI0035181FCD